MEPARSRPPAPSSSYDQPTLSRLGQPTVLVIDDEESMRYSLARGLRREGFTCVTSETGRAGVDRFMDGGIDAVLTDVRLPDLSGIDIVSVLGEINPDVPVIVMTGYGTMDTALEVMRRGAVDFVAKPLVVEDVIRTISRAIEERRSKHENRRLRAIVERTMSPEKFRAVQDELAARDVSATHNVPPTHINRAISQNGYSASPSQGTDAQTPTRREVDAKITERTFRAAMPVTPSGQPWPLRDAVRLFETAYVKDLLRRAEGNIAAASRLAGISRPNFHKKLKNLDVDAQPFKDAAKRGRSQSM